MQKQTSRNLLYIDLSTIYVHEEFVLCLKSENCWGVFGNSQVSKWSAIGDWRWERKLREHKHIYKQTYLYMWYIYKYMHSYENLLAISKTISIISRESLIL